MWLLKSTNPVSGAFLRSFLQNFSHELKQMIRFCVAITCSGQFYFDTILCFCILSTLLWLYLQQGCHEAVDQLSRSAGQLSGVVKKTENETLLDVSVRLGTRKRCLSVFNYTQHVCFQLFICLSFVWNSEIRLVLISTSVDLDPTLWFVPVVPLFVFHLTFTSGLWGIHDSPVCQHSRVSRHARGFLLPWICMLALQNLNLVLCDSYGPIGV